MNQQCAVHQAEVSYSIQQATRELSDEQLAPIQWALVEQAARFILTGGKIKDKRWANTWVKGQFVAGFVDLTFSMEEVDEKCRDEIETGFFSRALNKSQSAAGFDLQKFIGDMAHEVAFEALDLGDHPFIDLECLKSVAGV